jgi:micrococcal nuclease
MRSWRIVVFVALLFAFCARSAAVDRQAPAPPEGTDAASPAAKTASPSEPSGERAKVFRIVDGDTLVLSAIGVGAVDSRTGGRKARLIGVDTPEVYGGAECMGREASAFARRELDGKEVLVAFDVDPVDRYGRALVYVWSADGAFFNERIVAEGFASPMTVPPNVRYAELFVRAARDARAHDRGLWSRC